MSLRKSGVWQRDQKRRGSRSGIGLVRCWERSGCMLLHARPDQGGSILVVAEAIMEVGAIFEEEKQREDKG